MKLKIQEIIQNSFSISLYLGLLMFLFSECSNNKEQEIKYTQFSMDQFNNNPQIFLPDLISDSILLHKGILSNDLQTYYFTISDQNYLKFDIYQSNFVKGKWSTPKKTFINSNYSDHGMNFSQDGKTLWFSSTRPVPKNDIPETWHIWKSDFINGDWSKPEYVEISNLKSQLISHPTVAPNNDLYFHSSNLDYSDMHIYVSKYKGGFYEDAKRVKLDLVGKFGTCTPFITNDGTRLFYAVISESLDLYQSDLIENNNWSVPKRVESNTQGNPYVTPDGMYLFYTKEITSETNKWHVLVSRLEK